MTTDQRITVARTGIQLEAAVPTFIVADVAGTARWYVECLGFRLAGTVPAAEPYAYASLQRDGVELMLLRHAGDQQAGQAAPDLAGAWHVYVRMRGVHAFYDAVRGRDFIRMPLTKQSYGDWEFEVRDPNGYVLVFGELTA